MSNLIRHYYCSKCTHQWSEPTECSSCVQEDCPMCGYQLAEDTFFEE